LRLVTTVFVSHSKYDEDKINYIEKAIFNVGLTPKLMELEEMGTKYPAKRIVDIIRSNWDENTRAVVVVLGRNLENPPTATPQFTHNWVNFEVGVAAACNKPVWVLEDFNEFIQFPIPYVSDYCRYNLGNKDHLLNIGNFLNQSIKFPLQYNARSLTRCSLCNATYCIWDSGKNLNCPVCRRSITIQ